MTHLKLKISLAAIIFSAAVAYLAFAGAQKGWVYTLGVDQFIQNSEQQTQRVRLCGIVADQPLEIHKAQLTAKFALKGQQAELPVSYKGVIPDMFKAGCEVIIEGKRDSAGVFQADLLMTKCASKYEEMPKDHLKVDSPATAEVGGRS